MPPRSEDRKGPPARPRRETLPEDSPHRDYPPLPACDHLTGYLREAGRCTWSDGVARELSWAELESWARMTATPLTAWEARALHAMSEVYAGGANAARDPGCLPVWPDPEDLGEAEKDRRRNSLRAALRGAVGG